MDVVLHASRSHGSWQSLWSPRSSLARNASTSFRTISRRSNSHSPKTSSGSWMRSAPLPLSIQGGCCRSREPTVWGQVIAGSVYARRARRIDGPKLSPPPRTRSLTSSLPVTTVRGRDRPRPRAVFDRLPPCAGSPVPDSVDDDDARGHVRFGGAADRRVRDAPSSPDRRDVELSLDAGGGTEPRDRRLHGDRPSCEYSRLRSETRSGVAVPSQISAPCQQLDVLPHREGAAPIYWVFSVFVADAGTDRFAVGANDAGVCANLRREALKPLPPGPKLRECEPLVAQRGM